MFSKLIIASKTAFIVLFATLAVFYKCDSDLFLRFSSFKLEHSFDGKVIWITGASSGIGAYLTHDLVKAGAKVIISARRKELLDEIARECATFGIKPFVYPLDVKNYDDQLAAYKEILKLYGRVDILVLNPGISQRALALDTPLEDTQEMFDLNFFPYISLTKIVLPGMIKNGGGQIVVMSSLSGRIGTPIATSYSATKYALHGYFDGLRAELLPSSNITISIVCPGPVESDLGS